MRFYCMALNEIKLKTKLENNSIRKKKLNLSHLSPENLLLKLILMYVLACVCALILQLPKLVPPKFYRFFFTNHLSNAQKLTICNGIETMSTDWLGISVDCRCRRRFLIEEPKKFIELI